MKEVRISIEYRRGHSISEPWKQTEYFCPCCGGKSVWNRNDGGDYYQGETFMCTGCGADWNWPNEPSIIKEDLYPEDFQRLEKLREIEKG